MLDRFNRWLHRKGLTIVPLGHQEDAPGEILAQPTMIRQVRRFQGRYDCGHPWLNQHVVAPEGCPIHGEGCNRVYKDEPEEVFKPDPVMVPRSTFK